MRDDTDKNQWFTDGDKWILCPEIKFSTYWVYYHIDVNTDTVHKATVNVLDVLLTNIIPIILHNIVNLFQGSRYV